VIEALSFLTVVGRGRVPRPSSLWWFGPVGALVGTTVTLVWWGAGRWWSPVVTAVLVIGADVVATGMLHLDGLADTADGLLPHLERSRRLEVMAGPDVGAFAVVVVIVVLLARVAAVASVRCTRADALAVVGLWTLARTVMAAALITQPSARPRGLTTAFRGAPALAVAPGIAIVVALGVWSSRPGRYAVVMAAALAGAVGVVWLARRRLGGITGDVLGAGGVVAETIGLLALVARR
jgi:adenosylcobinamide-GDP ribazoletransferase